MGHLRPRPSLVLAVLAFLLLAASQAQPSNDEQHQLWLIEPPSRQLERTAPASQRLPETMCPTPASANDSVTQLSSGVPIRVRWRDPDSIPVETSKFELFSADGGHLLARLDSDDGELDSAKETASASVQIPSGLRCDACILRLSVELDERIQLLSCANVRIVPAAGNSNEECGAEERDCGGQERGRCVQGQCFCRKGFHGERCANASADSAAAFSQSPRQQSIRFPMSGSEFVWRADADGNLVEMGLRVKREQRQPRWFILGVQSTEADAKCQQAMELWKQKAVPVAHSVEHARAQSNVLLRLEQKEGDNSLMAASSPPSSPSSAEGAKKQSGLNIKRLENHPNGTATSRSGDITAPKCASTNEHFDACPEMGRECEPSCDWTAFPDSIPSCARRGEQCGQPRCVCNEGFVRLSNREDECKPFSFCQAPEVMASSEPSAAAPLSKAEDRKCGANETWEKCGNACEPSCRSMYSEEPCGQVCEAPGCTCDDNFVRSAEGKCIMWTECPNLKKDRVAPPRGLNGSSHAAGAATSLVNEVDGASEELDAAAVTEPATLDENGAQCGVNETLNECGRVCEADCVSIFERAECHQCATPSCACRQGFARNGGRCVYWGDCPLVSSSRESSASGSGESKSQGAELTTSPSSAERTLRPSASTTATSPSPLTPTQQQQSDEIPLDLCGGEWGWPSGCTGEKCLYRLSWATDPKTDSVVFALETRPATAKKAPKRERLWSGVGFSPSGTLLDADMAVLEIVDQERVLPRDMHVDEELGEPGEFTVQLSRFPEQLRPDAQQDINGEGHFANGLLKAKFWRKRRTGDAAGEDLEFGDEGGNCFRFLFPVAGGRFEQSGNTTVPVADSLYASDAEICPKACAVADKGKEEKVPAAEKEASKENVLDQQEAEAQSDTSCETEFRWPSGCRDADCEYRAVWAWSAQHDDIQFNVSAKGIGRWTGIGFSRDGKMTGADIVTGWVFDQKAYLTDRFAHAQQLPAIDPADRQNIFDMGGSLVDDVQSISFRRKVVSPDRQTDLSLADCVHFLFPVTGGRVLARSTRDFQNARTPIGFHDQHQPLHSAKRICQCERTRQAAADQRRGRVKRQHEEETGAEAASPEQGAGPYQCADITIFQVLDGGEAVRVVDAFGLSNDSLFRDEQWGGRQSIVDVHIDEDSATSGRLSIWVRRTPALGDGADLAVQRGVTPVFLASGSGSVVDMSAAERLEFAMVELIGGAAEVGPSTAGTAQTETATSTTAPTSSSSSSTSLPAEEEPSTSSSTSQRTTQMPTEEMPPHEEEPVNIGTPTEDSAGAGPALEEPTAAPPLHRTELPSATEVAPALPPSMFMDENCFGGFAYPEGCFRTGACQYMLEWQVQPRTQIVQFRLGARMAPQSWSGVGFSADGSMVNADALVVLLLPDGRVSVSDQFSPGYGRPAIDRVQNAAEVSDYNAADGLVSVNFSRPLSTGDREQDADLRECQYLLFLHSGGPLVPGSNELRKHTETPIRSENRICLGKCGKTAEGGLVPASPNVPDEAQQTVAVVEQSLSTTPTSEAPNSTPQQSRPSTTTAADSTTAVPAPKGEQDQQVQVAGGTTFDGDSNKVEEEEPATFNVAIRLTNERWDERLEDSESEQFKALAHKLANSLKSLVSARWISLESVEVSKFAEGSVLALVQMRFGAKGAPTEGELKEFLQEAAAQGMAEELIWDRQMLEVKQEGAADQEEDKWGPLREIQGWALVSVALLLLLCTVSALVFCAFRSRRRRAHRTYPAKKSSFAANGGFHHQPQHYATFGHANGADKDSDTTTAKTSITRGAHENGGGVAGKLGNGRTETPKGIGEATYREWFSKVASKDAPSHYQESVPPPLPPQFVPTPMARHSVPAPLGSPLQSYVSYPNDPAYYTMNGEHRIPPPAYYRPY